MKDELVTVFEDGKLLKDWSFEEIRKRAWSRYTQTQAAS